MTSPARDALLAHSAIAALAQALKARRAVTVDDRPEAKRAAVLAVVRPAGDGLELLCIKRAEYEGDPWSGHVALPGGRAEPGDPTLEATAVRETREETGIDIHQDGVVLGVLDEVSPRTPILPPIIVTPFVAVVGADIEPTPTHEVAAAFWVPLEAMRAEGAWVDTVLPVRGLDREVPVFRHGEYVVWGLTERILRSLTALAF